jgi:hypothetical protein
MDGTRGSKLSVLANALFNKKDFEVDKSSIPFFQIYHVAPNSSVSPSNATIDGTKYRTVSASHSFVRL